MVIIISGTYLKESREKIGLTQIQLAQRAGITQAHIAKIEGNKVDARLSTINKILSILEASKYKLRCKDIMTKKVVYVLPNDKLKKAARLMKTYAISNIPVLRNGISVGNISESTIINSWGSPDSHVKDVMEKSLPLVDSNETIDTVKSILQTFPSILVIDNGKVVGITTKSDLFKLLK